MSDLKQNIISVLDEKQAINLVLIDFEGKSSLMDYFILATAGNIRQMDALRDAILKYCKEQEIEVRSIQGRALTGWILIDLNDIVVHIFDQITRDQFQLEKLWSNMKVVSY